MDQVVSQEQLLQQVSHLPQDIIDKIAAFHQPLSSFAVPGINNAQVSDRDGFIETFKFLKFTHEAQQYFIIGSIFSNVVASLTFYQWNSKNSLEQHDQDPIHILARQSTILASYSHRKTKTLEMKQPVTPQLFASMCVILRKVYTNLDFKTVIVIEHDRTQKNLYDTVLDRFRVLSGGKFKRNYLDKLTVKELQQRCAKRKIKYSGLCKAELIAALRRR